MPVHKDECGYITYRCYKCKEKYCVVRIKIGDEVPTDCPYMILNCNWQKKGTEERYA